MADIIDLALVRESREYLAKLLERRGINYFLKQDAHRPFALEPEKVDLVVRTAARARERRGARSHEKAFEQARTAVRKELIKRVVAVMLSAGL